MVPTASVLRNSKSAVSAESVAGKVSDGDWLWGAPKCDLAGAWVKPMAQAIYPQPWSYAKLFLALRSDAQVSLG
jgi:hypothetical protein